jgi:dihydrofolate reductase
MRLLSLIAAIDKDRGLGKDNQLLCHLPADLRHFKALTLGKPIIMGRKTYLSIGKPLPGRLNIVLSHTLSDIPGVTVVDSLSKALELTADVPEVMIIGGAVLFKEALPLAHRIYLTLIHALLEADVHFPAIDKHHWECIEAVNRPSDEQNCYDLTFYTYQSKE